jgi:molybdopterin molybdotransferase
MKDRTTPKTLQEAMAFIEAYIDGFPTPITMPVISAAGMVLAETIFAPVALPRFDNAAMDGFAVRSADIEADGTAVLRIGQSIAAGQTPARSLNPGEAARIATGAPVPAGADRVVVQESSQIVEGQVRIRAQVGGKPHIRRIGEDIPKDSEVLRAGTLIGAGQLALLTALGIQSVQVIPKPKIGLLSTGDELVEAGAPLASGQIYDTNRPMLSLMLREAGAEVNDLGIIKDDPEVILSALAAAANAHDLLISSGGASVGFADHLTRAVTRRGYLEFWKLNIKPGKPVGFGDIDHCPILLLPGNPMAAAVGCALFGRSIVARLEGRRSTNLGMLRLPIGCKFSKPAGTTHILAGRLSSNLAGHATCVIPLPEQGSASLRSLSLADSLIILAAEQTAIGEGDIVDVIPLWRRF